MIEIIPYSSYHFILHYLILRFPLSEIILLPISPPKVSHVSESSLFKICKK